MPLLALRRALGRRARRRVFISYDHDEDARYKYLMRAWSAHTEFDFVMHETSPARQINSVREHVIRATLTRKLKEADVLLVIVGARTPVRGSAGKSNGPGTRTSIWPWWP